MTAENVGVQVSCSPKTAMKAKYMSLSAFYSIHSKSLNVVEIIEMLNQF